MWKTWAFKTPAVCTGCVIACPLGHICVCVRTDPTDGAGVQGPPTRGGCPHMQPCARRRARAPGAAAVTHGLAEEAVTQCWIPAVPHPSPGRSGHRGHVEPPGSAAGPARRGWRCWGSPWGWVHESLAWAVGMEGPWEPVPSGVQEEDAPGSGWHRARPDSRPSWAWGSGSGTFPGCLGRLRLCHPQAAVPGTVLSSSLGGLLSAWGARAAPPALGLPWIWAAAAAPPAPGAQPLLAPGSAAALAVSPVLGKGLG